MASDDPLPSSTEEEDDADINESVNLTLEDVVDFLEEKKVTSTCELCGDNHWKVYTEEDGESLAYVSVRQPKYEITGSFRTVAVVCDNCGNTRHLWRPKITAWLRERGHD